LLAGAIWVVSILPFQEDYPKEESEDFGAAINRTVAKKTVHKERQIIFDDLRLLLKAEIFLCSSIGRNKTKFHLYHGYLCHPTISRNFCQLQCREVK